MPRYETREFGEDGREMLVRINDDSTETELGCDQGEPEDNMFCRNWSWVPAELNRLAGLLRKERVTVELLQIDLNRARGV